MSEPLRVNVGGLEPGMVLARDVSGRDGRMLLGKGTQLTPSHLRVLNVWGVTEVLVRPGSAQGAESPLGMDQAEVPAQVSRYVEAVLALQPESGLLRPELERLCLAWAMHRWRENGALPVTPTLNVQGGPLDVPGLNDLDLGESSLASVPDIYVQIISALENPASTAQHLADLISKDANLVAKLLRLVNSPLYGFAGRIDSLSRGVALVGTRELTQLALGISVLEMFPDIPVDILDIRSFWKHSLGCAVLANNLAAQADGLSTERCFVSGILHDVGRLVLLRLAPRAEARAMALSMEGPMPLHEAEREILGYDHAQVTARLFDQWKLPEAYREIVTAHHAADSEEAPLEAAVIQLADVLAIAMGIGLGGSFHAPPLPEATWRRLGLPLGALEICASQARRQLNDIFDTLLGAA